MRRFLSILLLTALAVPAFARGNHRNGGMSMSINDGDDPTACSDIRVTFDGDAVPMVGEQITAASGLSSLRVNGREHSGIRVSGWNGGTYSVLACKAAAPGVNGDAIRVSVNGNEVSASGPDEGNWVVYYLIRAPRGASLNLEASNGPIAIDGVDGDVTARVTNGPISVKESKGRIDVSATNGPLSITGGSGDVKARATNGPVSVSLSGTAWQGNLDASTQNGPVSVKLPRGYLSGVTVEATGNGPITCRADECRSMSRYDDENEESRRIQLGSGPTNVRVSTVNGPLSIRNN
jgi:hypothetical protein